MSKQNTDKQEKEPEQENVASDVSNNNIETKKLKRKRFQKYKTKFAAFISTKKRKVIVIIIGVIILLGILAAIPLTRYAIAAPFIKKDVTVTIIDSTTRRPINDAVVSIGKISAKSDTKGTAVLKAVRVGQYNLKITKQYYSDQSFTYTVPVFSSPKQLDSSLTATGRQVSLSVTNKVSGDPLDEVTVSVGSTSATTSSDGTSVIILPADKDVQTATLTKDGYNTTTVSINVNDVTAKNDYQMTPSGSVYYLSKITGTINVMKANLDGSSAKVVVTGTGKESDTGTVILSARDWKYSVLLSKRDSDKDKVYLIDSLDDSLTTIDEGDASFSLVGWSGHNFVYLVYRNTPNQWDNKREALKIYNADTKKLTTVYETAGSGTAYYNYQYEDLTNIYIFNNEVTYIKSWQMAYTSTDMSKNSMLISLNPASFVKKVISEFSNTYNAAVTAKLYIPQGMYIRTQVYPAGAIYYDYEDGNISTVTNITDDTFNNPYPTYLISPSGNKTFWSDPRDGKNTLLIGDQNAKSTNQIASLSDYTAYGWYSDDYILLSKNSSELYIASANKPISDTNEPVKITNFHKPQVTFPGYGYGYGGQ